MVRKMVKKKWQNRGSNPGLKGYKSLALPVHYINWIDMRWEKRIKTKGKGGEEAEDGRETNENRREAYIYSKR